MLKYTFVEESIVGRKNTFPLLLFGIVLITALSAILAINYLLGGPALHLSETTLTGQGDLAIPTDVYTAYAAPIDLRLGSSAPYATATTFTQNNGLYVNISVKTEPGVISQYVYKTGKYSQSNAWQEFTFSTPSIPETPWILGNATVIIGPFRGNYTEYVAIFVCRKYTTTGAYICGPKSATSDAKNWTLINFTVPALCTDDAAQFCLTAQVLAATNTSNGTGVCPTGKLCYKCAPNTDNTSGGCFAPPPNPPGTTCLLKAGQFCTTLNDPKYNFSSQNTSATCGSNPNMKCFSCASTFANQSGGCFKTCTDQCTPGNTSCVGQQIKYCQEQSNGCYDWNAPQSCSDPTRICETGSLGTGCFAPTCTTLNGQCLATQPAGGQAVTGGTCLGTNQCYTCGTKTNCNGVCVDLQTNASNCGVCGRTVGATEVCVNGNPTCGGCNINSVCIQNGQIHPTNSCLSCNTSKALSSWSPVNLPASCTGGTCDATGTCVASCTPTCPAANTVNCGIKIMPSNNCGTCTGNGTLCPSSQSCSTTSWTCTSSCTPVASGCVYANSCSTTGTDNCGNANAAICNRQTNGNSCTVSGQQSTCQNGACQTPVCTTGAVRCIAPPPYAAAYARVETCQNGQWVTTQTCVNVYTCAADGESCGAPQCSQTNGGVEKCDGIDNNCNGQIDENGATLCDDSNGCTTDSCSAGTCSKVPNTNACTTVYGQTGTCSGGSCQPTCAAPKCTMNGICHNDKASLQGMPALLCTNGNVQSCGERNLGGQTEYSGQKYLCTYEAGGIPPYYEWKACGGEGQVYCAGHSCNSGLARCGNICTTSAGCTSTTTCGHHGEWQCKTGTPCVEGTACTTGGGAGMCWWSC
jgi:hypothetical protein